MLQVLTTLRSREDWPSLRAHNVNCRVSLAVWKLLFASRDIFNVSLQLDSGLGCNYAVLGQACQDCTYRTDCTVLYSTVHWHWEGQRATQSDTKHVSITKHYHVSIRFANSSSSYLFPKWPLCAPLDNSLRRLNIWFYFANIFKKLHFQHSAITDNYSTVLTKGRFLKINGIFHSSVSCYLFISF